MAIVASILRQFPPVPLILSRLVTKRCLRRTKWTLVFGIPVFLNSHEQNRPKTSEIFETKSKVHNRQLYLSTAIFVIQIAISFVRYILIFTPILVTYPIAFVSNIWFERWTYFLLRAIQTAGPVSVKLGQWASTRRDLFSLVTCDVLSHLQRTTVPHSWNDTEEIISQSFGRSTSEIFSEIEKKPVGSGCVAQVYKAKLKPELRNESKNGPDQEYVAVKVLHPGIEKQFRVDIAIMRFGTRFLNAIYWPLQWLDLPRCVDEFEKIMLGQVDMRLEAESMERFHQNFSTDDSVRFPRPVWSLVSKRVLVETFEEGIPIVEFCSSDKSESLTLRKKLANIGANTLLKMVFQDNFVHGDLHPGNLLVRYTDPKGILDAYLVVLDCGIVTKLHQKDLRDFRDTFKAIILNQGEQVANLFLERSYNRCENPDDFRKEMAALVVRLRGEKLTLRKVKVGDIMQEVFSLMIRHKVRVESQFSSVVLACAVLEGLGRSLDPDMDLLNVARPYVIQEMASGIFTETKNYLDQFLEESRSFSPFE